MSDVRAKFYVAQCNKQPGGVGEVVLRPATRGAVNASWAQATPSGEIKMHVNNPAGFAAFEARLGREFYVDFTEYHPEPGDGHKYVPSPADHYNRERCAECSGEASAHSPVKSA